MSPQEMSSEFDLYYDNLSSHMAAGLDEYEKSVYLTRAQDMYVEQLYRNYEKSEEVRKKLDELVRTAQLNEDTTILGTDKVSAYSHMYRLPQDCMYIVYEHVIGRSDIVCLNNKLRNVLPVTHDDLSNIIQNPFRFNKRRVLRLDTFVNGNKYSELIVKDGTPTKYTIRYIKKPNPIILETITTGETINGQTLQSACELNESIQREIIKAACQLAYMEYKQ